PRSAITATRSAAPGTATSLPTSTGRSPPPNAVNTAEPSETDTSSRNRPSATHPKSLTFRSIPHPPTPPRPHIGRSTATHRPLICLHGAESIAEKDTRIGTVAPEFPESVDTL